MKMIEREDVCIEAVQPKSVERSNRCGCTIMSVPKSQYRAEGQWRLLTEDYVDYREYEAQHEVCCERRRFAYRFLT